MNKRIILILVLALGLLAFAGGVYLTQFHNRGYVETTAVIERIETEYRGLDENRIEQYDHTVYVRYTVDGEEYAGRSDTYDGSYKEGMEIKIFYDPENPAQFHGDSKGFATYLLLAGPAAMLIAAVMLAKSKRSAA